jgi:hypothetical protein
MRPQAAADRSPVAAADAPSFYLAVSRPFLESHVPARVRVIPNLRFLDRCDIVGLATTPDGRRVTGVRVLRRVGGSAEEVLGADLVADAIGCGSRTPIWLEALGYSGWRHLATGGRRPSRCGSGWAMRPGPTGCRQMPSAAIWGCRLPRPSIHGLGRCCGWRVAGGW